MTTKTIISKSTIHIPGPDYRPPLKIDIKEIPPGTPVELDAEEADRLIARGVAEVYPPVIEEPPGVVWTSELIERSERLSAISRAQYAANVAAEAAKSKSEAATKPNSVDSAHE